MHPAIKAELEMLRERFPGKPELTLDEYAEYHGISRGYAAQHLKKANSGPNKINHKRIGRKYLIPLPDFAVWLAQRKIVDGRPVVINVDTDMKRRRGFAQKYDYRGI